MFCIVVSILFPVISSPGTVYALDAKAMFSTGPGSVSPGGPSADTRENGILKIDGYDAPASFFASAILNMVLVLDQKRSRICKYSLDGGSFEEINLEAGLSPIDMAYFPETKKLMFLFRNKPLLGVVDLSGKVSEVLKPKIFDISDAIGGKDPLPQKIWPCAAAGPDASRFIINAVSGKNINASFVYKNEKLSAGPAVCPGSGMTAGASGSWAALCIDNSATEAVILKHDLAKNKISRYPLLKEFIPKKEGYGCRGASVIGCDAKDNIYVEALYSSSDENVKRAYVYRFNSRGRFTGRVEIFASSELFVNRYISVDPSGAVFYMKRDGNDGKLSFYRFAINEKN